MSEYFQYNFDDGDGLSTNFLELDSEGFCTRAILEKKGQLFTSNFISPTNPCVLPEGCLNEFKEEMSEIEVDVFKSKWSEVMNVKRGKFEMAKIMMPIGTELDAKINCFYPQGVILNIASEIHGIANYQKSIEALGQDKIHSGTKIRSRVIGYDEENLLVECETVKYL